MIALSIILFALAFLWMLVGVVPLPLPYVGGMAGFPKRHPWIFVGVLAVLLGGAITLHILR